MTVRPGSEWGRIVDRPVGLVTARSDADLTDLLREEGGPPVMVAGGDLARTFGTVSQHDLATVLELPIDLIDVSIDDADLVACAHVVVRSRGRRGGWWFGPVVVVMNAEFIGEWDVAPRGHPNDGRVEVIEGATALSVRDRLEVRRRLPLGTHVPHPAITTRSVREAEWSFASPMAVVVDGRRRGQTRTLAVRVRPDAAIVHA